ncbi:hypothetical protein [Streptomyces chumphonensis]|uniref:hypothetical protein n=1 Tax=Streptomyces chumphonensis TaxID=1214925 RepID=UPI003D74E768
MSFDAQWAQLIQAVEERKRRGEEAADDQRLSLADDAPGETHLPAVPDLSLDDVPIPRSTRVAGASR